MQMESDTAAIRVLLNVSLGESFKLSSAAIQYASQHFADKLNVFTSDSQLAQKRRRRFNEAFITAVEELGPAASDGCAIRVFRLHPFLDSYATIRCSEGAEILEIDESQAWRDLVQMIETTGGDPKSFDALYEFLDAVHLQDEWAYEDSMQTWDQEAQTWLFRKPDES